MFNNTSKLSQDLVSETCTTTFPGRHQIELRCNLRNNELYYEKDFISDVLFLKRILDLFPVTTVAAVLGKIYRCEMYTVIVDKIFRCLFVLVAKINFRKSMIRHFQSQSTKKSKICCAKIVVNLLLVLVFFFCFSIILVLLYTKLPLPYMCETWRNSVTQET